MKDNAHAESRVLSLFHLVIILIVILILMAVFLYQAIKVRDEAIETALKQNTMRLQERILLFRHQWSGTTKSKIWTSESFSFPVTENGWPAVTTAQMCNELWFFLLSTKPEPLIQHVQAFDDGCIYSTEIGQIIYDFHKELIFIKK